MEVSTTAITAPPRKKRRVHRLAIIAILGLIAIGVSLWIRNSPWAHERRLRTLSAEELALAIHDSPNDPLTFVYFGSALLKNGKTLQDFANSEQAFAHAVQLDPKMARAHLGLASALLRQGKALPARKEFEEAAPDHVEVAHTH